MSWLLTDDEIINGLNSCEEKVGKIISLTPHYNEELKSLLKAQLKKVAENLHGMTERDKNQMLKESSG